MSINIGEFSEKLRMIGATLEGEGEDIGIASAATFEPPHHRQ
ncbi:hypothetical protein [uncultured Sphingopyxis sp.]|nr:hypothetical protein [uncultured Sphingopyxis sp.]